MNEPAASSALDLQAMLADMEATVEQGPPLETRGRVVRVVGTMVHAVGVHAPIGGLCEILSPGVPRILAEVVGFEEQLCLLTPMGSTAGLSTSSEVRSLGHVLTCPVGRPMLGRVVDALGRPIDGREAPVGCDQWPVWRDPVAPMQRQLVQALLPTGVRAIDGLLSLGVGQRIGIFAPPGVGKSTLLSMLARGCAADVIVIGLIGERGREVRDFVENQLGDEARKRCVVVVSTSDRPPKERIQSAHVATTLAEYFRDQGLSVLLLVDSLTRLARAQREIGLAAGEPPTRRSYPPSVFAMLPQLLERAGQGRRGGITAIYTVLTEGDEDNDPIAEEVRSILDGHIVLSRRLAAAGHFPAIDVLDSVSRVMPQVVDPAHLEAAADWRQLLAKRQDVELLVQIGEFQPGADALADQALWAAGHIDTFLKQGAREKAPLAATRKTLGALKGQALKATAAAPRRQET